MEQTIDIHGKSYKKGPLIAVLMVGTFCTILNQTILATAFPALMETFHISTSTVQWLSTGFLLVNGIMIPITAWLIGRVPTRRLYFSAMFLFLIGTVVSYTATGFPMLLCGRLIQALGVGVTMPLLQTIMLTIFPPEKRGAAMGMAGMVIGLAPAIGPTLSGYIIDHSTWRNLFGILIPIVFLVLIGTLVFMKDVIETKKSGVDMLSIILSTLGFGSLLFGFSSVGDDGWTSAKVLGFIAFGVVFLAFFIFRQLRLEHPFLELRVFQYKDFTLGTILASLVMMAMIGAEMVIPIYLQSVRGETAFESGLTLLFGALMMGIMSPITGRTFDNYGPRNLTICGMTLLTLGTLPFIFLTENTPMLYIVILYAIRMFGISMVMMPVTTSGMNALPPKLITHGTAANNTVRQIASSIGTAVLISVLSNVSKSNMPSGTLKTEMPIEYARQSLSALLSGYHATFILATSIAFIGVLLSFTLKKSRQTVKEGK